ncbi:MAG: IclR family transcriptional regulator [Bradyrhizobiaceae bacterium]|nr:MAG: IclR family transcriptional regulator [Bradyrhizobiaceae bacterium]
MGRRSERLTKQGMLASDQSGEGDVIQVVSRAFDILRCFEGHDTRLGNLEISKRCGLPRSTVSRLTHTLTRMGQLAYLPGDQKYRIGSSAVAMSTSMTRGLQVRNLIRMRLQEVAEQIPGTIGFTIPDRHHMVYLEYARADHALGLHSTTGSRIAMGRTAAGHTYVAALDEDVGDAMIREMAREMPEEAGILRSCIDANRQSLRDNGYVIASGMFSPHITGIAVPIWSPHYQTFVVVVIGVLSAMYDDARMASEVGPVIRQLSDTISVMIQNADSGLTAATVSAAPSTPTIHKKLIPEGLNELEAGTRRPGPARSLRAGDGRR